MVDKSSLVEELVAKVRSAYVRGMSHYGRPTMAGNSCMCYVHITTDGEVSSGTDTSVGYSPGEYFERDPHPLTLWFEQPYFDDVDESVSYDADRGVYTVNGEDTTEEYLTEVALEEEWGSVAGDDIRERVREWAARNLVGMHEDAGEGQATAQAEAEVSAQND